MLDYNKVIAFVKRKCTNIKDMCITDKLSLIAETSRVNSVVVGGCNYTSLLKIYIYCIVRAYIYTI